LFFRVEHEYYLKNFLVGGREEHLAVKWTNDIRFAFIAPSCEASPKSRAASRLKSVLDAFDNRIGGIVNRVKLRTI